MSGMKITFPRLKCLSQRDPATITAKSRTMNTIATEQTIGRQYSLTLQERLSSLKVQYINKSPNYFRRKNLSLEGSRTIDYPSETIEHYIAEQGKIFDKQMLLELARSRARKISQYRSKQAKREQQFGAYETEKIQKKSLNAEETRYSNFRPLRMPIKHAIKGIKHPDLTLPIRLS